MESKNRILDAIEKDLLEAEEFYIPIKKIWYWLKEEYADPPALEDLTKWLKADKRFIIHDVKEINGDDADLEDVGYFTGPRVGLKRRQPSKEDMARIIAKHAGNVTKFLKKAQEVQPDDLTEEEKKMLEDLIAKAKAAEQKIKDAFKKKKK